VIKCLKFTWQSGFFKTIKLQETVFFSGCQPKIGKFSNNAKGKISKQSNIQNCLKFMDEIL